MVSVSLCSYQERLAEGALEETGVFQYPDQCGAVAVGMVLMVQAKMYLPAGLDVRSVSAVSMWELVASRAATMAVAAEM